MKMELRRLVFEEQARTERRRTAGAAIESQVTGALKPWREVLSPHQDVASGRSRALHAEPHGLQSRGGTQAAGRRRCEGAADGRRRYSSTATAQPVNHWRTGS